MTAKKTATKKTTAKKTTPQAVSTEAEITADATVEADVSTETSDDDDLIVAQAERIKLLEAELDAVKNPPPPQAQPNPHSFDEVYVKPGTGQCLLCSCVDYQPHPEAGQFGIPADGCWACNHSVGEHKRNLKGAVRKAPEEAATA